MDLGEERALRERIMHGLTTAVAASPDGSLSRDALTSFLVDGEALRLIDRNRGIWNPRWLLSTLSIVSSPDGPYADETLDGGLFVYDYRSGTDAGDNTKLRRAHELDLPIILLRKVATGAYVPIFPVYIIADDRPNRRVYIALDESLRFLRDPLHPSADERRYSQRVARQRLHQPAFRAKVLRAYEVRCAVCSLRHGNLLDAAHIIADGEVRGAPVVPNGVSLCKIHHAAYDTNLLGISPDYGIHIARGLLEEIDGPMLRHGLQEMDGTAIIVPSRSAERPDRERLEVRFQRFREVS